MKLYVYCHSNISHKVIYIYIVFSQLLDSFESLVKKCEDETAIMHTLKETYELEGKELVGNKVNARVRVGGNNR